MQVYMQLAEKTGGTGYGKCGGFSTSKSTGTNEGAFSTFESGRGRKDIQMAASLQCSKRKDNGIKIQRNNWCNCKTR
jgi:hypothetical protein